MRGDATTTQLVSKYSAETIQAILYYRTVMYSGLCVCVRISMCTMCLYLCVVSPCICVCVCLPCLYPCLSSRPTYMKKTATCFTNRNLKHTAYLVEFCASLTRKCLTHPLQCINCSCLSVCLSGLMPVSRNQSGQWNSH